MNAPSPPASGRSPLSPPWGSFSLEEGSPQVRRVGPRDLWFLLQQGEVRLADAPAEPGSPEPSAQSGTPEHAVAWTRWALPGSDRGPVRLSLRPAFPDRALIVQPEVPFALLPRAEARVFVRIPLSIQVELEQPTGESLLLRTIPTIELSDTWWGGFLDGDLCYWLPTSARREVTPELLEPHLAICPLLMVNEAVSDLPVEKLSFRVEHLSLFSDGQGFWADESRVRYQGDDEGSHIDMTGRAPAEASDPKLVLAPPIPARGIRALTFHRLRYLSGLGGLG
jgi:hypothetical protein